MQHVTSKDSTHIAYEQLGQGPALVIVGGVRGDHQQVKAFPLQHNPEVLVQRGIRYLVSASPRLPSGWRDVAAGHPQHHGGGHQNTCEGDRSSTGYRLACQQPSVAAQW